MDERTWDPEPDPGPDAGFAAIGLAGGSVRVPDATAGPVGSASVPDALRLTPPADAVRSGGSAVYRASTAPGASPSEEAPHIPAPRSGRRDQSWHGFLGPETDDADPRPFAPIEAAPPASDPPLPRRQARPGADPVQPVVATSEAGLEDGTPWAAFGVTMPARPPAGRDSLHDLAAWARVGRNPMAGPPDMVSSPFGVTRVPGASLIDDVPPDLPGDAVVAAEPVEPAMPGGPGPVAAFAPPIEEPGLPGGRAFPTLGGTPAESAFPSPGGPGLAMPGGPGFPSPGGPGFPSPGGPGFPSPGGPGLATPGGPGFAGPGGAGFAAPEGVQSRSPESPGTGAAPVRATARVSVPQPPPVATPASEFPFAPVPPAPEPGVAPGAPSGSAFAPGADRFGPGGNGFAERPAAVPEPPRALFEDVAPQNYRVRASAKVPSLIIATPPEADSAGPRVRVDHEAPGSFASPESTGQPPGWAAPPAVDARAGQADPAGPAGGTNQAVPGSSAGAAMPVEPSPAWAGDLGSVDPAGPPEWEARIEPVAPAGRPGWDGPAAPDPGAGVSPGSPGGEDPLPSRAGWGTSIESADPIPVLEPSDPAVPAAPGEPPSAGGPPSAQPDAVPDWPPSWAVDAPDASESDLWGSSGRSPAPDLWATPAPDDQAIDDAWAIPPQPGPERSDQRWTSAPAWSEDAGTPVYPRVPGEVPAPRGSVSIFEAPDAPDPVPMPHLLFGDPDAGPEQPRAAEPIEPPAPPEPPEPVSPPPPPPMPEPTPFPMPSPAPVPQPPMPEPSPVPQPPGPAPVPPEPGPMPPGPTPPGPMPVPPFPPPPHGGEAMGRYGRSATAVIAVNDEEDLDRPLAVVRAIDLDFGHSAFGGSDPDRSVAGQPEFDSQACNEPVPNAPVFNGPVVNRSAFNERALDESALDGLALDESAPDRPGRGGRAFGDSVAAEPVVDDAVPADLAAAMAALRASGALRGTGAPPRVTGTDDPGVADEPGMVAGPGGSEPVRARIKPGAAMPPANRIADAAESPYSQEDWRSTVRGTSLVAVESAGTVYRDASGDEEGEPLTTGQRLTRAGVILGLLAVFVMLFIYGPALDEWFTNL